MSDPIERLESEARRLSVKDRARLAHRLLESLDDVAAEDPAAVERAWEAEVERRIAEYGAGTVGTVSADDVFRDARDRLRRR